MELTDHLMQNRSANQLVLLHRCCTETVFLDREEDSQVKKKCPLSCWFVKCTMNPTYGSLTIKEAVFPGQQTLVSHIQTHQGQKS